MLKFPTKWRVAPPPDGELFTATIPQEAREEFFSLAQAIAINTTERKRAFEEFKRGFAQAKGGSFYPSSSADYAVYDLRASMTESCANAPKFLEEHLDFACSLKSEAYSIERRKRRAHVVESGPQEAPITFFLDLLAALQSCGTVPAMDLGASASAVRTEQPINTYA